MWWLIGLYVIHTIGELCLSPIGLSMVSKLAPLRLSSLMMGTWFLANAAANKFAGTLSALIPGGEDGTGGATSRFLGFQITNLYEFFHFIYYNVWSSGSNFVCVKFLVREKNA